jgi:hypothetical protein
LLGGVKPKLRVLRKRLPGAAGLAAHEERENAADLHEPGRRLLELERRLVPRVPQNPRQAHSLQDLISHATTHPSRNSLQNCL